MGRREDIYDIDRLRRYPMSQEWDIGVSRLEGKLFQVDLEGDPKSAEQQAGRPNQTCSKEE